MAENKTAANELVTIRLFYDGIKYKDDVFLAVNGKSWQIKRGEDVAIPAYAAKALEQSMTQDEATAALIVRKSTEFEVEAKARNI